MDEICNKMQNLKHNKNIAMEPRRPSRKQLTQLRKPGGEQLSQPTRPSGEQLAQPRASSGGQNKPTRPSGEQLVQPRTSSGGQNKPRRPAPRKAPPPPATGRSKLKKNTPSEELLLSSSLSIESKGDSFANRASSLDKSATLPRSSKEVKSEGLQRDRSVSTEPLLPKEDFLWGENEYMGSGNSQVSSGEQNSLFGMMEDQEGQAKQVQYTFSHTEEDYLEASTVVMNLGAQEAWKEGESGQPPVEAEEEDDFILEPPVDFSQSTCSMEKEEDALHFAIDEQYVFQFGPDDSDSPAVGRRESNQPGDRTRKQGAGPLLGVPWGKQQGGPTPTWLSGEHEFAQYDHRDALEEDDVPNVVFDDEVAALIW